MPTAIGTFTYVSGKPVMMDYTPGSALAVGDGVVVGSMLAIAQIPCPTYGTTVVKDAVSTGGGIYYVKTDGTPIIGQTVYFNTSTLKLTATAAGNVHAGILVGGPTGDMGGSSPASDGDYGYLLHRPSGAAAGALTGGKSEATASTTASLTAAQIVGGFVNSAPSGAITLTTPTAALLVAGIKGAKVGDELWVTLENTSGGANTITLAGGSGATFRGNTSVAQNKSALLHVLLTNVTASSEAYTVHSIVGA